MDEQRAHGHAELTQPSLNPVIIYEVHGVIKCHLRARGLEHVGVRTTWGYERDMLYEQTKQGCKRAKHENLRGR